MSRSLCRYNLGGNLGFILQLETRFKVFGFLVKMLGKGVKPYCWLDYIGREGTQEEKEIFGVS
jgi:hypothetical protein